MGVVAIIPARGGSKGVPGKNLRRVGGRTLVARAIDAATASRLIDRVVVSTDDPAIALEARAAGAEVVLRPADLSGDTASSESALLHALDKLKPAPRVLAFIQATSPFIDAGDLDAAIDRVLSNDADSVFSGVESHTFLWKQGTEGATGINHDSAVRLRRQEREAEFAETGAFYVMRTAGFRQAGHRFFGRVAVCVVDTVRAIEIDTEADLRMAQALAPLFESDAAIDVDALVTDFDGVHTDDRVLVGADGREFVIANRSDGAGIEMLRKAGFPILILSKEVNPVVTTRGRKLHVDVRQGIEDKATEIQAWAAERGVDLIRTAYVGNDLNDLPAMRLVGWPIAVADAHPDVIAASRVVLSRRGGDAAIREVSERILRAPETSHHSETPTNTREQPWPSAWAELQ